MGLKSFTVQEHQVSDLFFNYEHPAYDEACRKIASIENIDTIHSALREAILQDAIAFAITAGQEDDADFIDALVVDFLKRL